MKTRKSVRAILNITLTHTDNALRFIGFQEMSTVDT